MRVPPGIPFAAFTIAMVVSLVGLGGGMGLGGSRSWLETIPFHVMLGLPAIIGVELAARRFARPPLIWGPVIVSAVAALVAILAMTMFAGSDSSSRESLAIVVILAVAAATLWGAASGVSVIRARGVRAITLRSLFALSVCAAAIKVAFLDFAILVDGDRSALYDRSVVLQVAFLILLPSGLSLPALEWLQARPEFGGGVARPIVRWTCPRCGEVQARSGFDGCIRCGLDVRVERP